MTRPPVQGAAAAVRLRRLRLQSLLAEHHALPVVLLHRRAGLPIGVAATTYMVASIWDGIANFVAGVLVDRQARPLPLRRRCSSPARCRSGSPSCSPTCRRRQRAAGRSPSIFVAHLLFRTAYAGVNVPYLAMTARISADAGDRAFVAGMRMLFGTAAAVTVALCTVPVGRWLTGSSAARGLFRRGDPVRGRRRGDPAAGRRDLSRSGAAASAAARQASGRRC